MENLEDYHFLNAGHARTERNTWTSFQARNQQQLTEHIVLKHSAAFVILTSYINDDDEYIPVIMLYFSDSQMAKSLTQDRSQRTIGYINDEDEYVPVIMFNLEVLSMISSHSDAFRAYRAVIRPLHVDPGAPTSQEIILLCEDIFK